MLMILLACTDAPPPAVEPAPPEPVVEVAVVPPEPTAMPDGVPQTTETVALVGYGIRFTVHPPFQAAWMANIGASDASGKMVVSWWDVNADKAGQNGISGLYNVAIEVGPVPEDTAVIQAATTEERGETVHGLRLGDSGTVVWLPKGHNALGGMGTLEPGPAEAAWKVQVGDAEPMEWPGRAMLHSWDPADGGPASFQTRPSKPWGPWME